MTLCVVLTAKGQPCQRAPLVGRDVCQAHAPERATGRPTKLTPTIHRRIVEAVREGAYFETAARLGGIWPSTLYSWLERGEADEGGVFSEFSEALRVAEAEAEHGAVQQLLQAGERSWQAAIAFLERRFPERWGKDRAEVEDRRSAEAESNWDLTKLSSDELRTLQTLYEKARLDPEP